MSHISLHDFAKRAPFQDPEGEAVLRTIEAEWRAARGTHMMPDRTAMGAQPLAGVLAHSFTLERVTSSVARFRVAGDAIRQLLSMEPRGMPISAMFTPQGRQMLAPLIYDVCESPAIVEIPLIAHRRFGMGTCYARIILLPLRTGAGPINTIFGALVLEKPSRNRPMRFDFDVDSQLRTEELQPVIRTIHEVAPDMALASGPAIKGAKLRLVVDNT